MINEQNFSLLDVHFSKIMTSRSGLDGENGEQFKDIVQRLSAALNQGHSCLPLTDAEKKFVTIVSPTIISKTPSTPLVLSNNKLYLQRYFQYESRLAKQISVIAKKEGGLTLDPDVLDKYFGKESGEKYEIDWQRRAAEVALKQNLTIISGGPGTGKTTTIVKILAILLEKLGKETKIVLAAPTGKAAMRLRESVGNSLASLPISSSIKNSIPTEAVTLHRLLGVRPKSPQFRHNSENPLLWDVVIVDEASMVDLAMMSKLVDALRPDTRLILLGDKDQLSSVESGAVLADCIKSLPANTVELQKSYRFDAGIKQFAQGVIQNDVDKVWQVLNDKQITNVNVLKENIVKIVGKRYSDYMNTVDQVAEQGLQKIFDQFAKFKVLCGVRKGPFGVEGINRKVEEYLISKGFDCEDQWYSGRPVLITRNDYSLGLYNGDVGICLADPERGGFKVWFEQTNGNFRCFPPFRIPACETVYAMTIHKSQGSEFEDVLVILPTQDSRVLSRELIYTGVTRAKKNVTISTGKEILNLVLERKVERFSGLVELLKREQ